MANQYGINLGEVYRTAEAVKGSRQQRKQSNQLMEWQEADRDLATEQRRQAGERENMLAPIRQQAAAGDPAAQRQLIALSPDEGVQITEAVAKMDDRQRKAVQENVDMMGRLSAFILNAENPEQAFARVRNSVPDEMRRQMPDRYDQDWVMMELARAQEVDQLLKDQVLTIGGEDVRVRGGVDTERTPSNALVTAQARASGEDTGPKSADESLMYRQSAELFGGIFDQQGNLQNLDPQQRGNAQAVATEAARLFAEGGRSRTQAVTEAARKLNIVVPNLGEQPQGQQGNDNRNELLQRYLNM